jgi:vitamin B12 transporter
MIGSDRTTKKKTYRALRPALGLSAVLGLAAGGTAFAEDRVNDLGTVVFSANRTQTEEAAVGSSVTVITRSEIEKSGEVTVKDLLTRVPGLGFSQAGPTGSATTVDMRGLGAGYILVRIDGIDISDPSLLQTAASLEHLMTGDVERIEVLRGSQSALYGGTAVAGVIDITTRNAAEKGVHHSLTVGAGSYRTASARYGFTAATDAVDFAASIERFHTDGFSSSDERNGNPEKDGYGNTTASASVGYRISDSFRVFGAVRHTAWDTAYDDNYYDFATGRSRPADETGPSRYHTSGASTGVRGGVDFGLFEDRLKSTVAVQHYTLYRDAYDAFPAHYEGKRTKFEYLGNLAVTDAIGLSFGVDHAAESAKTSADLDADITNTGVFAQGSWKPFRGVTLTAALRNDHHSMFGDHTTHRLTAAWDVTDTTKLRASWGTGFRPPSLYQLYDPSYGNAALKPEESRSFDIGIDQRFWDGRLQLSATWFKIDTDNLIDWVSTGYWTGQYSQVEGVSKRQGVELSGKIRPIDGLTFDAAYTYTDAVDSTDTRLKRVPHHKASLGASWLAYERTTLNLRGTWVSDAVDSDFWNGGVRRLPDYFLVDAGVNWAWDDRISVALTGKNLFDRKYETVWGYGTPGRTVYASLSFKY